MDKIAVGITWYVVFLFSLVCHEAAHAWAALRLGDKTAYDGGQVSLNPLPHIRREPIGTIVVPILSFVLGGWMMGWASTPYDYQWARQNPKKSALMALAGPAANLALFIFMLATIRVGYQFGWLFPPQKINFSCVTATSPEGDASALALLISVTFSLNLILFIFNLLPLPLFDGKGFLLLLANQKLALGIMDFFSHPGFRFVSLIIAWKVFGYVFSPVYLTLIDHLYPGVSYY